MTSGIVNQSVPPFVVNLVGGLLSAAIIGLAVWVNSVSTSMEGLRVRQETQSTRFDAQSVRITDMQNTVAAMQVQVVRDLQEKSDEVLNKIEKSETAREVRGQSLDSRLNDLVDALGKLSNQVAVIAERVDIYISGHPMPMNQSSPPQNRR